MKNSVVYQLSLFTLGLIGGIVLCFFQMRLSRGIAHKQPARYRVALVGWHGNSFSDEVIEGVLNALDGHEIEVIQYFARDKMSATSVIEEITTAKYDLLITVGGLFTQVAKSITERRNKKLPVVFAGVADPAKMGVVDSEERPGGNITGITLDNLSRELIMNTLLHIKPTMKRVLIPWDPLGNGGIMEKVVNEAKTALRSRGVEVFEVVIESVDQIHQKIAPFCGDVDSIIVLPGSQLRQALDAGVKLCNQHEITLASIDLNALNTGASIAWGSYAQDVGFEVVEIVKKIFYQKQNPGNIPVNRMKDWCRIAVNPTAAKKQGLHLSDAQLFCLKNGMVIDDK